MKRRDVYRHVNELAQRCGSRAALLDAAAQAMRALRGLKHEHSSLVQSLLASPLAIVLQRDDALGEIYQALNAPALQRAYRGTARDRRKFADAEIPSVTQLFTPRFVVQFLLQNTLGRIYPDQAVESIRILDPACGTMNFGLVAIDMLVPMYRARSVADDEIPSAILKNNLFGIDIDPVALELAAQALSIKLRLPVEACRGNLWRGDALMDAELEAKCVGKFDVVVTNPPYLSARNLDPLRVSQIKRRYPASWRDAYACFIERSLQFARDGGRVGILAMQSFMFTGAFQKLRRKLSETAAIEAIAHFGPGLFQIGNPGTLQTAAVVLRKEPHAKSRDESEITALRLIDAQDKEQSLWQTSPTKVKQSDLLASSRMAWTYWLTPATRRIFARFPKLKEIAEPRQGLATTDNARFVRYWWEVEPTRDDAPCRASFNTWFPYAKSGRFRRWFEPPRHRVNWADDGRHIKQAIVDRYPYLNGRWKWVAKNAQFYGRAGVTYSYLTAGAFSARLMPHGAIFDVAGSAIFPEDPLTMLAILNSACARELLHAVNPTVNFQVGDLAELPVPCGHHAELSELAARAVQLQQSIDACDETSSGFISPDCDPQIAEDLARVEAQIDAAVARLFDAEHVEPAAVIPDISFIERARRSVSYIVGRLMGRWGCDREIQILPIRPPCDRVITRIRDELTRLTSPNESARIEQTLGGVGAFLAGPFYGWHLKLYRGRPVYWLLGDAASAGLVLHDFATPQLVSQIVNPPKTWQRSIDDGVLVNLAPLFELVPEKSFARKLRGAQQDLEEGHCQWSKTAGFNRASNAGSGSSSAHPASAWASESG